MPERAEPETPAEGLERYATTLRRWWALAAAVVAVAALAGFAVATQLPKSYDATAKVLLDQQRQVDSLLGTSDFSPDPERELNTSVQLITLEPIADGVRRSLGLAEPSAALVGKVATAVDRNSSIVSITVRDASAARAARIANAFATGYRQYRARSARAGVAAATASAQARLRRLPPGPERTALRGELRRLQVAEAFQTGGVQVVHRAGPGSADSRPRPMASALAGGLLGLVLAALAILVLARTDARIGRERDLEDQAGRPVVARIPRGSAAAEDALLTLALSLARPRAGNEPPSVVLLASPGPGEGTAEVALGLARALGAIGRCAIAVEADLRDPVFARRLGLGRPGGLAAILGGAADLERELAALGEGAAALPAGATSDLPQPLLAGERMAAAVAEARSRADVVLLAGAPAGVVGDCRALVPLADAVLLVARLDVTRRDELERAVRALAEAGSLPLGVVITLGPPGGTLGRIVRRRARRRSPAVASSAAPQGGAGATGAASEATVG